MRRLPRPLGGAPRGCSRQRSWTASHLAAPSSPEESRWSGLFRPSVPNIGRNLSFFSLFILPVASSVRFHVKPMAPLLPLALLAFFLSLSLSLSLLSYDMNSTVESREAQRTQRSSTTRYEYVVHACNTRS